MMSALLLARAGVDVTVLEKHKDFLRDFRGDTIHPSTLEVLYEMGILDDFLTRPHQKVDRLTGVIGGEEVIIADFTHLKTRCHYVAFMPQWDFLNFLKEHAEKLPNFHLKMETGATDLIEENGRVVGVRAGATEVRADLVLAADGRNSVLRAKSGLEVVDVGAPMDVLWMRLSRKPTDPAIPFGRFDRGKIFVQLYRDEYWQCAFVIQKGGQKLIQEKGMEAFRESIAAICPMLADRVHELRSWDDVKLLTVSVNYLKKWFRPGLLFIGDAAHAMSPVGGVGINIAIQDAVAAANLLAPALRRGNVTEAELETVQHRRELAARWTQRAQIVMQNRVIGPLLQTSGRLKLPLFAKLLRAFPRLRRIPARLIGVGFRPEHVRV